MYTTWIGPTTLLFLSLSSLCTAQTSRLFQWQFAEQISTDLPTCREMRIIVKSFNADNSTHGTPPYYMRSFELGGLPTTTLIGTDENDLRWTVTHPLGKELMLVVVDANGSSGGVPTRLFKVTAGQSITCIQSREPSTFTVTSNITGDANTCDPWGLTIVGGSKPYSVTLAALSSPVITNVTMGALDDRLTYINRADPNTILLASVTDFTGRYAFGTPSINTRGSTDIACTGLNTVSGNNTEVVRQIEEAAAKAASDRKQRSIVIGVCVSVGVVALLVLAGTAVWYWRRKNRKRMALEEAIPHKFQDSNSGQVTPVVAYPHDLPPNPQRSHKSAELSGSSMALMHAQYANTPAFDPYHNESSNGPTHSELSSSGGSGSNLSSRPSFAAFPTTSRRMKAQEAGIRPTSADSNNHRPTSFDASPSSPQYQSTTPLLEDHPEIIIQHRDGGVVRELPPPYADRSSTPRQLR
ncbi:hypothetical protein BDN71DRAFT_1473847 [Pleurotus eryngii]|uniref:Mid2 domain-containing protein n=1 Tax=Pleurotus eryngii TaxID=5323 RepID=A0A9P5ZRK0_PLEER|nr:hypothetical protein BDN71DRAFT_1473847 [Pleurotus eryngii]